MDGPHVEGVVEVVLLRELDARVAPRHAEDADDEGGPRLDVGGGGRDRGQTGDRADARTDEGGLAFHLPFEQEPEEERGGGGDFGIHRRDDGGAIGEKGGTSVEAEPTEPEETGTESDERNVVRVRVDVVTLELLAVGQSHDGGQGGETGGGVHDNAAGEILDALASHPAFSPHPVAEGEVHKVHPDDDEDDVRHESHAIGERASHESRRDDGEHALETGDEKLGNVSTGVERILEHVMRSRASDDAVLRRTEAQRVSPNDPNDGHQAHGDVILHHDGEHVGRAHQPPVEEGQARRHEIHERHADENVPRVSGIHRRRSHSTKTTRVLNQNENAFPSPRRFVTRAFARAYYSRSTLRYDTETTNEGRSLTRCITRCIMTRGRARARRIHTRIPHTESLARRRVAPPR